MNKNSNFSVIICVYEQKKSIRLDRNMAVIQVSAGQNESERRYKRTSPYGVWVLTVPLPTPLGFGKRRESQADRPCESNILSSEISDGAKKLSARGLCERQATPHAAPTHIFGLQNLICVRWRSDLCSFEGLLILSNALKKFPGNYNTRGHFTILIRMLSEWTVGKKKEA